MKYKYGVVIITDDAKWFQTLGGLKNGLYCAIKLPAQLNAKIGIPRVPWLKDWLQTAEKTLWQKLKEAERG